MSHPALPPSEPTLGRFPVSIDVSVAWGDMDALAHVNNTVYLRWFESSRISYFEKLNITTMLKNQAGPILARTSIDYRIPVTYPDKVTVDVTVLRFGRTSMVMGYRVKSHKLGLIAAEGETVIVMFNYELNHKVEIDEDLRQKILILEASAP